MAAGEPDSQLMNYLVRMVVPMRREFGRSLDVGQFLHDRHYAREVIGEALQSQDARLVEYASYVEKRMHGARIADSKGPSTAAEQAAPASDTNAPAVDAPLEGDSADDPRARIMKKYTVGLR